VGDVAAVIDLHCHVLPGVDDGVRTLGESVELARAAAADGVTAIAATPHVRQDYPTTADTMEAKVAEVNEALREANVDVEILPGGELALEAMQALGDGVFRFGLGGNPKLLLLEFPYHGWPLSIAEVVFRLRAAGVVPLIAHPERNTDASGSPERLRDLADAGAYFQITAASLDGRLGRRTQAAALRFVELGFAHVIASDAHHPGIRATGLTAAREAIGDEDLGRWLTEDVPRALLAGDVLPPRPESPPARRRLRFLR
jgi:protein-tyrosine phosphatase